MLIPLVQWNGGDYSDSNYDNEPAKVLYKTTQLSYRLYVRLEGYEEQISFKRNE